MKFSFQPAKLDDVEGELMVAAEKRLHAEP